MKEKLKSLFLITRPINFLITFASVIVSAIICSPGILLTSNIFLAALSAGFTASAGNIINDIFDIEIDEINRPDRPLPSGRLKINEAYILYLVCFVISGGLVLSAGQTIVIIVLFSHLLLFLYSKYLKGIPFVGNIAVAFLTGLVFIFGGVVIENPTAAIIPACFAFLINLIREIVKDMEDVEGDKSAKVVTFPIKFGFKKSKYLIAVIIYALILFTIYPFIAELYAIEYFVIVMIIVNPLLVFVVKKLFEDDSVQNLKKMSNLLKLTMVFGLIAIYLGV
ncbi:MAG TPA: geranylgeranylglycerol-phosphate geranylgeranyltransferase [Ignavibacteriaceae bacterium]